MCVGEREKEGECVCVKTLSEGIDDRVREKEEESTARTNPAHPELEAV